MYKTGLQYTQGTQGIQVNLGNFQVKENLRQTQGSFNCFYIIQESFLLDKG